MKNKISWLPALMLFFAWSAGNSQTLFRTEGNGLFNTASGTSLDVRSIDDNTNALLRFGDNNQLKLSLGFNGNEDFFKISTATTLGADDLTLSLTGQFGINTLAGAHRMLINHNSTSGTEGGAHLTLQENNTGDYARLRFENLGEDDGHWLISAATPTNSADMRFYYSDGLNEADLLTLDGDNFRVGIHQTAPLGYLHVKQKDAGVDALAFVNDNATGGDKWSFRIGDEDILIYFNNDIRGGFDVSTGNYNNFPPSPALAGQSKMKEQVLDQLMQLPVKSPRTEKSGAAAATLSGLDPYAVEKINPEWVVRSEDGSQLGIDHLQFVVLAVKAVQEQQELLAQQQKQIAAIKARKAAALQRLQEIGQELEQLGY